jgi:hypothetical protein
VERRVRFLHDGAIDRLSLRVRVGAVPDPRAGRRSCDARGRGRTRPSDPRRAAVFRVRDDAARGPAADAGRTGRTPVRGALGDGAARAGLVYAHARRPQPVSAVRRQQSRQLCCARGVPVRGRTVHGPGTAKPGVDAGLRRFRAGHRRLRTRCPARGGGGARGHVTSRCGKAHRLVNPSGGSRSPLRRRS